MARARGLAVLVITADEAFARAAADRVLAVSAATGELTDRSGWRRFLRGMLTCRIRRGLAPDSRVPSPDARSTA